MQHNVKVDAQDIPSNFYVDGEVKHQLSVDPQTQTFFVVLGTIVGITLIGLKAV